MADDQTLAKLKDTMELLHARAESARREYMYVTAQKAYESLLSRYHDAQATHETKEANLHALLGVAQQKNDYYRNILTMLLTKQVGRDSKKQERLFQTWCKQYSALVEKKTEKVAKKA